MSGHLVLIGLSGSGKTTLGRRVADLLRRPFYDTDALLAARAGVPVPDLLRADPTRFRALESEVVRETCRAAPGVISTGGGVVLAAANRDALRAGNLVVWLRGPLPVLLARMRGGEERPLLAGGDPLARLARLSSEREPLYAACAHVTVESVESGDGTIEEMAARLRRMIEDWEGGHGR